MAAANGRRVRGPVVPSQSGYRHGLSVECRRRPRLPPSRTVSLPAGNRGASGRTMMQQKGPTGSAPLSPIVELRRYDLVPGTRDTLIDIFDRRLIEGQEAEGMAIIGQFRDLDDPDSFVWLRGFADMETRRKALDGFYSGPVLAGQPRRRQCDDAALRQRAAAQAGNGRMAALRSTSPTDRRRGRRTARAASSSRRSGSFAAKRLALPRGTGKTCCRSSGMRAPTSSRRW